MNVYRVSQVGRSRIVEALTVGDALAIYRQDTFEEPQDVTLLSEQPVIRDYGCAMHGESFTVDGAHSPECLRQRTAGIRAFKRDVVSG